MRDASSSRPSGADFLRQIVAADAESGRYGGRVVTRFPPEPNGFLHVGHAKSICLNFGIASEFGGRCHLRFDDTNPETADPAYVRAIQEDVRWLGFDWGEHLYFASDYFERMYECALVLIEKGLAYVDSATEEVIRAARGTVREPGRPTLSRARSVEENLDLFRRMRAGDFPDGSHVLRGKIDLASPNMIMRDPVFYRIRHATHHRTGDEWCVYPLYDWAHCLEDAFEGVTHSLCTLEFDNNREIYDWILDHVGFAEPRPHQYEFNRLNLEYTVVSKRKLARLVREGHVEGWDDPRMPTLAGLRRRGVPPEAIRRFVDMVGVAKTESWVDPAKLEFAARDALNRSAPRVMAVLDPLKVVVTNVQEDAVPETLDAPSYPDDVGLEGSRPVPFGREVWIERGDFSEDPPSSFRRLVPGGWVRLRHAYAIRCEEVVRDEGGEVAELRCAYDPASASGSGRGPTGVAAIHWVAVAGALEAEVRLYDRLFTAPYPEDVPEGEDFTGNVNPGSLVVVRGARIEPSVADDPPGAHYQFERLGYFRRDPAAGAAGRLVFNRVVPLKDTWARRRRAGSATSGDAGARGGPAEGTTGTGVDPSPSGGSRGARDAAAPAAASPGGARSTPGGPPVAAPAREAARRAEPELAARMERYTAELGLSTEDADVLTGSRAWSDFFEAALAACGDAGAAASWSVNDLRGLLGDREVVDLPFGGDALGRLVALVSEGTLTRRAGKDVLAEMVARGGEPSDVARRMGLERVADADALEPVVDGVLAAWSEKVSEYRGGRAALLGLFVGEVMKATGGAADPKAVRALLLERLERGA